MMRTATVDDLPKLAGLAHQFYSASAVLGASTFDILRFIAVWEELIRLERGVIFLLENEGVPVGVLGAVSHQDLYQDRTIAAEMFWFVDEAHRGDGLKLLDGFEHWAKGRGACEARMVHLSDSMPERLESLYHRKGYRKTETTYSKGLL